MSKRKLTALCALALAGALTGQAWAVGTSAASAVLIEQESGRVLYEQNPDEERLIASITKIMTAVVALERGEPPPTWRRGPPCTLGRGTCCAWRSCSTA